MTALVYGRTKRAWLDAPLVRQWSNARHLRRLGEHAAQLPWIPRERFEILSQLRASGVTCSDTAAMVSDQALDVAERFVARLRPVTSPASSLRVSPAELAAEPVLFRWGLGDDNLDLAENYIGLPVRYLGVEVKREKANGLADDVRQWHMDVEDRRMLKIIVYLSDVTDGAGPFEYIDPLLSQRAARNLRYRSGFVSDTAMNRVVSREHWKAITAPRLSAVFVDSCRVFHRAQPPSTSDRYSMTFSYSSVRARQVFPKFMLDRDMLRGIRDDLTPRQRRAAMID